MKKEILITAKSIEAAVELGAAQLNMKKDDVTYEVIELAKKGFLGIGSSDAKVKVFGIMPPEEVAVEYLSSIINRLNLNAKVVLKSKSDTEICVDIISGAGNISGEDNTGSNLGLLIGYHGEVLDSLQYLTFLAVNKDDEADIDLDETKSRGVKIHLDIENYREKRKQTLEALARKMADKVLKYKRPVTLEHMNSFERRIIHSVIQDIEGVTTYSVGQDADRKIVITKEGYKRNEGTYIPRGDQQRPARSYGSTDYNKPKTPYKPYKKYTPPATATQADEE